MKKRKYLIIGIFLALGFLIFNKTLSELKPIPKVTFKSQKLNYDKKEPGSFKVDKSAKWIGEGKAKITIDVESIMKESSQDKDIIFVLDVSGSMSGDKLNQVKKDTTDLATAVLSNPRNRAALITFDTGAELVSGFTNNKAEFLEKVNSLIDKGATNYKAGLEEARKLLEDYKTEERKDLVLLFLTDGFPNEETPNEVAIYNELKQKYPYMSINAVQYEMGDQIQDPIKAISERQFPADMKGLNNVLFEAGANSIIYDNFVITDYISKHFKGSSAKIKASQGEAKIEGDQITWNLGTYRSGTKATLEIELDHIGSREEFYKTNKGIDIKTSFEKQKDDQISSKTPILKDSYKVIYEGNSPQGCTVKNLEKTISHRPFEKIALIKGEATCDGYLFQGYELITDAKYINEDYIEMPEKDVIFRATWTKAKVDKGMQGTIASRKLYEEIKMQSLGNDKEKGIDYKKANSPTNGEGVYLFDETKNDTNPVYFFRGTHQLKNNLLYANLCWKIVRTTETGGVRVVYNGTPINGKCINITGKNIQIGDQPFNTSYNKKQYVGYMFGDDANPYQNINNSDIKKYIDNWYKTNIKDKGFESNLDKESIYCGDRTEDGRSNISYAGVIRAVLNKPSLKCPSNDSYGLEAGNRKLRYPVGLLTIDEIILAGTNWATGSNRDFYLYTGNYYWLLSPSNFRSSGSASVLLVDSDGGHNSNYVKVASGVRPVITIAPLAPLISGDGSQNNPYFI